YAPRAAKLAWLFNLRDRVPGARAIGEKLLGIAAKRSLMRWRRDTFFGASPRNAPERRERLREVALFVDTFTNYFEPENARAALKVLEAAGYRVTAVTAQDRPLCCGRTFLAAGLVDEAKAEARRMIETLKPYVERGVPVVGLEPSCLFGL